jgi:hypothetical protein
VVVAVVVVVGVMPRILTQPVAVVLHCPPRQLLVQRGRVVHKVTGVSAATAAAGALVVTARDDTEAAVPVAAELVEEVGRDVLGRCALLRLLAGDAPVQEGLAVAG